MAWSAAVRRDAPSSAGAAPAPSLFPRLQLDSLGSSQEGDHSISIAVIDANALISFDSSARLLSLAFSSSSSPPRFVTVTEVLEEVRAPASRFHLASLPCSVDCIDPSDEALRKVLKFARETGDLHSLSDVDLKLLALTYMLEEQTYGYAHLRARPPPVHVAQVRHVRERDLPGWGSNVQNLEEWEQLSHESDDIVNQDSHILGLKKLSLNEVEQENIVSSEEQKHAPHEANGHGFEEGHGHGSLKDNGVEHGAELATEVKGLLAETHESTTQSIFVEEHSESSFRGAGSDGENFNKAERNVEEDEMSQDGEDWQKSISRSTRRKHERRAARSAVKDAVITKEDVESTEGNRMPALMPYVNDANPDVFCEDGEKVCEDKGPCCSCLGNEGEDAGEVHRAEEFQDNCDTGVDCQSNSDSFCAEEEHPVSIHDTTSEESWALRPLSQSKVACVTADFPMQNVLLQIGLRVVSPNGLQIQQLQRWALKCQACRNVTSDVGRIFCPKCGNGGTLYKVSITIGPNGVVHTGTRRRTNIRGTKYSLPLPKGGRQGVTENPILREDQLPQKMLRPKKKVSIPDLSSPAEIFAMKSGGKEKMQPPIREALAIFSGKRNPNRCRSKQRG
eukprot:c13365_g1_i1 orf=115-1974(+)